MKLDQYQEKIASELTEKGWVVLDDFFDPELILQLRQACLVQQRLGLLKAAGVGRAEKFALQKNIRSDQIRWLEPGMDAATDQYLEHMDQLRGYLNRRLFLGLQETEQHFAVYSEGDFYQKHLDRFQDEDRRVISSVLYLNPDWNSAHGGALRLHLDGSQVDIAPVANRYVLFIASQIVHEVLPAAAQRLSLTGWFKRHA